MYVYHGLTYIEGQVPIYEKGKALYATALEPVTMNILEQIRHWEGKPKELVASLTRSVDEDGKLFAQLVESFKTGSVVEQGICGEVMKYVTRCHPEFALPHINAITEHINDEAPKVKWGTAEVVGNVARKFPDKIVKAVPRLLVNTRDSGTVTRWCAAYALTEIAKSSSALRKNLVSKFPDIVKREKNNGVKNVYLKTLKQLDKH